MAEQQSQQPSQQQSQQLQPIEVALEALLAGVTLLEAEQVALGQAAGRVVAAPIAAIRDVPSFDNSAMDGYALRAADAGKCLPISQRIAAGSPVEPLREGTCARIFTGGEIPPGADCVVMQERVTVSSAISSTATDNAAQMPENIPLGDNVRRLGDDVRQGDMLLEMGVRLEAAALGHLAGQGVTQVSVRRRPRVALLSTGDEIVEPGQPLAAGQLYNSNRPMLKRLLESFGAEVVQLTSVPDDYQQTLAVLSEAAAIADVVITTGGVSVGEEDHVKHALEALGELDVWRLAVRPGKPLALGRLPRPDGSRARFVGLPGNPVSSYVGAWLFLRPLMGGLLGCPALTELPVITAKANFSTSTGPRQHYMRAALHFGSEGAVVEAFADQSSAVLSSCVAANVLAVVEPHQQVTPGDLVRCLWLQS